MTTSSITLRSAILLTAIMSIGCASTMKSVTLKRAAFDLECPHNELQIQQLTTRTWGVEGCGQRATYITEGECSIESSCRPIMNSPKLRNED